MSTWNVTLRSQQENPPGSGEFATVEQTVSWEPSRTAIILCDMWDKHWCDGASRRVDELAPAMNAVVQEARRRGLFIIHAPSDTMDFYAGTPQRLRAQQAPASQPPLLAERPPEPPLPIDDSDGGCDTEGPPSYKAWARQHPAIEIAEEDALSDDGDEVFNLLQARGIENVILMGVHTNMCVLGRPFAIRSLARRGKNVVLMRDMTDAMYNPRRSPFVSHARGTELVVEHIERYWCPSLLSSDLTGQPAFRFAEAAA